MKKYDGWQPVPIKKSRPEFVHSIGEKHALRFWTYDDEYLYGPSRGIRWPHDRPLETLGVGKGIEWTGFHGVYAWKELQPLYNWLAENQTQPVIVGTVLLWGSIIEHKIGWRAQFGRVHTLDIKVINGQLIPDHNHIRHLRENYGV